MLSTEKKTEVLTNFLYAYCKMLACGIQFEEEKCDDTRFFFTWPEKVAEDCVGIDCSEFDDGTCTDLLQSLIADPKKTGLDSVKKFVVHTVALSWIDNNEVDDFEIDWWYEDLDASRKMLPIKLFAKPRVGQVWTAKMANELISTTVKQIEKNMDDVLNKFAGYSEV